MRLKLKALGLALFAALALSAVAAAGAAAQDEHTFHTSAGQTAHLTASATNDQIFKGQTGDTKEFVCKKVDIVTGTGTLTDGSSEITAGPKYEECKAWPEGTGEGKTSAAAFPEFTTCHYLFKGKTTEGNPTGGKHATVGIKCTTAGDKIDLKVTALKLPCVEIPEQEIPDAVTYTNIEDPKTTKKAIEVHATPHAIKVRTPNTAACPTASGKEEIHTNGTYTGTVAVTGFKDTAHTESTDIYFDSK
jgi:hypothetical protein